MPDILAPEDYSAIRELLGVSARELSDATVEQLPFLPSVELAVKRLVSDWSAVLDDEAGAIQLKSLTMHLVAIALIPRLRNRLRAREGMGGIGGFTSGEMNWDALRADLQRQADADLVALTVDDATAESEPFTLFTVGGVSRSSCRRAGSVVGYR